MQSTAGGSEGDDAVEAVALAENENRLRQVRIVEILAAENRQQNADRYEADAEGREDAVDFQLALAFGAANQRLEQHPVDRPVQDEGGRNNEKQREQRA